MANSDAIFCIKRIDKEMQEISAKQHVNETDSDTIEKEVSDDEVKTIKGKRCIYFNWGFCKYKNKCQQLLAC